MLKNSISNCCLNIVAPVAWGLCVLFISTRIERAVLAHGRRNGYGDEQATLHQPEYHI